MTTVLKGWVPTEDRYLLAAVRRGMDIREIAAALCHSRTDTERRLSVLRGNRQEDRLADLVPGEFYRLVRGGKRGVVRFLRREGGRCRGREKWLFRLPLSGAICSFTAAQAVDIEEFQRVPEREARAATDCWDTERINGRVADTLTVLGYGHQGNHL